MGRSIHVSGVNHSTPIPAASVVGNVLASSLITGRDPATATFPATFDAQCDNMFAGIRQIVEGAGDGIDDIVRITFWVEDRSLRNALNRPWVEMFPDPDARPARLTLNRALEPGKLIECEILAVLKPRASGGALSRALTRLFGSGN